MDIDIFCTCLHNASFLPVYLYRDGRFSSAHPQQDSFTLPPKTIVQKLLQSKEFISCEVTSLSSFYGCVRTCSTNEVIIIGPANQTPYTRELLYQMHKEYQVPSENIPSFDLFFTNIPVIFKRQFDGILSFINYILNNKYEPLDKKIESALHETDTTINTSYFSSSYIFSDIQDSNNSAEVEKILLPLIESGDVEGLQALFAQMDHTKTGTMVNNNLRQIKNTFIVTITLATRAALKGGLPAFHAYHLSDTYIQKMESMNDVDAITRLSYHALLDFTSKTRDTAPPLSKANVDMLEIITYVQKHMNEPLTVESIAHRFGYNRSFLSRKFKSELGFDLSAFILRCRLETSKKLLTYTNKSLSEISIYLCFSSQSHFQNAFKKQFSLTPMQYRRKTSR